MTTVNSDANIEVTSVNTATYTKVTSVNTATNKRGNSESDCVWKCYARRLTWKEKHNLEPVNWTLNTKLRQMNTDLNTEVVSEKIVLVNTTKSKEATPVITNINTDLELSNLCAWKKRA